MLQSPCIPLSYQDSETQKSSSSIGGDDDDEFAEEEEGEEVDGIQQMVVTVKGREVALKRASCDRASREGIPRPPGLEARIRARETTQSYEGEFIRQGRRLLVSTDVLPKASRSGSVYKGNSKSPAPNNSKSKISHLQTLKSRTVDQFNNEPAYLLCDRVAELQYDRLAESALRANAGSQAVTKRKPTQGASNQTSRINCRAIGMSAAAQCSNACVTLALAEMRIREHGIDTFHPMGFTSINPAKLVFATQAQRQQLFEDPEETFLPVISTTELVFNSMPTKLGPSSIRATAQELARRELSEKLISNAMYEDTMLTSICRSIGGGYEIDAVWAAVVLIVFLSCDPRGRRVLATTNLTDMDLQTAYTFEWYGRSEITRRVRLIENQSSERKPASKRRKRNTTAAEDTNTGGGGGETSASSSSNSLMTTLENEAQDDARALGTKRRRNNKTMGTTSSSDSYSLLDWWFRALRSNQSSVLETLIASSRDTARQAAQSSLQRQACGNEEVSGNKRLNGISVSTAVRCCEEVVRLVHHHVRDTPMVVCAKTAWTNKPVIGILPKPRVANRTAIYACAVSPLKLQPHSDAAIVVLHASATQELAPRSVDSPMPGILERYSRVSEIRADEENANSAKAERVLSSIESFIQQEAKRPLLSVYAGMTRSFIAMKVSVPITASILAASNAMCKEATELYAKSISSYSSSMELGTSCNIVNGSSNASYIRPPTAVLQTSQKNACRLEPICNPCSRIGIGIRLNELLRRWMTNRTRKNGIAAVSCAEEDDLLNNIPKDMGWIMDSEPLPLSIIVDFKMHCESVPSPQPTPTWTTVGASFNVCLDGAVRVPELVNNVSKLFERRALIICASSQASYISDVGAALSAQWANCSSASSKKVSCADVNTLPLLSIWDVYAGGLANVHRNYTNTAYSGAYGCHVDTGITSPGLLGIYYRADKRQHGTVSVGQEAMDKLCELAAESHFVPVGDSHYAKVPLQTQGIPHGFVPGLHTVLNDFSDAIETYRELSDRTDSPTVDSLFVFPFSAFTQALAPDVEATVDLTIRHAFRDPAASSCATGRSYMSDTTAEEEAIFVEPLWRRPCQVSSHDNPFATSYSYADSMFNACNLISVMAIDVATRYAPNLQTEELQLEWFHDYVCKAVFTDVEPDAKDAASPSLLWACDFLVLVFGCIYPASHAIDEELVPIELSVLSSKMATRCKKQERKKDFPVGASFSSLISSEAVERVRILWSKFSKRPSGTCAWKNGLEPLLLLLMKHRGSNDVSREMTQSMRKAVDGMASAAWLVYSKDGTSPPPAPNPLCECPSPSHVRRNHVDPIFCAQGNDLEIDPRGALIGIQPFQLRQIYALMMGSHLKNARPQAVRNEGGLNLRLSSASDILKMDGKQRSEKAISPLQIEADMDAFGTRDSKLYGCALQRSAWDKNISILSHLFHRIEGPADKERRARGEWGEASWLNVFLQEEEETKKQLHDVQKFARNQLERSGLLGAKSFAWAR